MPYLILKNYLLHTKHIFIELFIKRIKHFIFLQNTIKFYEPPVTALPFLTVLEIA